MSTFVVEEHQPIVFGPVKAGAPMAQEGRTFPCDGWVWSCTCGAAGFGFTTEEYADEAADLHVGAR